MWEGCAGPVYGAGLVDGDSFGAEETHADEADGEVECGKGEVHCDGGVAVFPGEGFEFCGY